MEILTFFFGRCWGLCFYWLGVQCVFWRQFRSCWVWCMCTVVQEWDTSSEVLSRALGLCLSQQRVGRRLQLFGSGFRWDLCNILSLCPVSPLPLSPWAALCLASWILLCCISCWWGFFSMWLEVGPSLLPRLFFSSCFGVLFSYLTFPTLLRLSVHKAKCNSDAFSYEKALWSPLLT